MGKQNNVIQFKKEKKGYVIGTIVFVFVILLIILLTCFKIDDIEVSGNKHYTEDEIKSFVLSQGYIDNSVLLMLKNKVRGKREIPFIAKLDIEYLNAHKVSVTVYEKAMAGCVEYMNEYVYFDQDGYVLEISQRKLTDSPCITGMSFSSMELREKLPIEDKDRFNLILKLTQLINKHNLKIDSIRFTSENEIVMKCDDIRIELGDGSNLEEQLLDLDKMLEGLKGKRGTLNLRDFDTANGRTSFKIDNQQKTKEEVENSDVDERGENDTDTISDDTTADE